MPGCDPTGIKGSSAAIASAFAMAKQVVGKSGSTYLVEQTVTLPPDADLVGNGATLRIGRGGIGFRLPNPRCRISGWIIEGNGAQFAVLNASDSNEFSENVCRGDIGHFFFSVDATNVLAQGNYVEGETAATEITTALLAEGCKGVIFRRNHFRDIPVGWAMSVRDETEEVVIANNDCRQRQWSASSVAMQGQRVFRFSLGSPVHLKRVQIDGLPRTVGYTIQGKGHEYIVTFLAGRKAGEVVKLVGYRGAENIQINSGCKSISITGNFIDGSGDSGILLLSPDATITDNVIKNCGYAGIAIYSGGDHATITGNRVVDCAQMDDGHSSPDFPQLSSVFAGGILISAEDITVSGNQIDNSGGTMRYGIRINKSNMALRVDGRAAITLSNNVFRGEYPDGEIFAINDTRGERINSVVIDSTPIAYPAQIDIDQYWRNHPPSNRYFRFGGSGQTQAIRDTAIRRGGKASIRTVAGEYLDIEPLAPAKLRNCAVEIRFWAKNGSGSSYVSIFTELSGLLQPLTATITDRAWRQYTIRFIFADNLGEKLLLRIGAKSGSANIEDIEFSGRRL